MPQKVAFANYYLAIKLSPWLMHKPQQKIIHMYKKSDEYTCMFYHSKKRQQ